MRGGGGWDVQPACMSARRDVISSNAERHEALVLSDVAFEDVGAGTEDALEALPIQLDALELAARDHRCRTWSVENEGDFT